MMLTPHGDSVHFDRHHLKRFIELSEVGNPRCRSNGEQTLIPSMLIQFMRINHEVKSITTCCSQTGARYRAWLDVASTNPKVVLTVCTP